MKLFPRIFFIFLLLLWCSPALSKDLPQGKPASEEKKISHETPKQQTKPQKQIAKNKPFITNKLTSPVANPVKAYSPNCKHEQHKESWMHKLTNDPTATFTALLSLITLGLWWATLRIAIDSKKTARDQLRAYVLTAHDDLLEVDQSGYLTAIVTIKNLGQTPAKAVKGSTSIQVFPYPLKDSLKPVEISTQASQAPLGADESVKQIATLELLLNQTEVNAINDEKAAIFVWGEISYVDIFNKGHNSKFCLYSTGADFSDMKLAYYDKDNETT